MWERLVERLVRDQEIDREPLGERGDERVRQLRDRGDVRRRDRVWDPGDLDELDLSPTRSAELADDVEVLHDLGAADLVELTARALGVLQARRQRLDHVRGTRGLGLVVQLLRDHQHVHLPGDPTQHLEARRTRPDDEPGADHGHRHAMLTQVRFDVVPAPEVLRDLDLGLEPAQVDDLLDPSVSRGAREVERGLLVALDERALVADASLHGVDQVEGGLHIFEDPREVFGIERVPLDDLEALVLGQIELVSWAP